MSVAGVDHVHDSVEEALLPISDSAFSVHEQPEDVSNLSNKRFSEASLEEPAPLLKEDVFNRDVSNTANPSPPGTSTEAHDTVNGHLDSDIPSTDAVSSATAADTEEKVGHETEVVPEYKDIQDVSVLVADITASDSAAVESVVHTTTADEGISISVGDDDNGIRVSAADAIDGAAAAAEHKVLSNSESVADATEDYIADKTINDSAIEIVSSALEKAGEEKDDGPADKPQEEVVDAVKVDEVNEVVTIEDTREDTNHTQIDVSEVEEAKDVDVSIVAVPVEAGNVAVAESAAELNEGGTQVSIVEEPKVVSAEGDAVQGDVSEGEAEVPVTEANNPSDGANAADDVELGKVVQEATVHEAEPDAAEINNAEDDGSHEAVVEEQELPAVDRPTEVDELFVEGEPDITVDVEEASLREETATEENALDDVLEVLDKVEEPAKVQDIEPAAASDTVSVPVVAGPAVEIAGEETAGLVEAEPIGKDQAAPEESETVAEATKEEVQAPVEAEPIESTNEEAPAATEAEHVIEVEASVSEVELFAEVGEVPPTEPEPVAKAEEEALTAKVESVIQEGAPVLAEVPVSVESEPIAEIASKDIPVSVTEDIRAPIEAELITVETSKEQASTALVEAEPAVVDAHTEATPEKTEAKPEITSESAVNSEPAAEVLGNETAPVEAQVEEADSTPVEAETATAGITQEKVAVEEMSVEEVKDEPVAEEIAPGEVSNTESEIVVEGALPKADNHDAEIAHEGTSVALATSAVEQTPSAVESKTTNETSEGLMEAPAQDELSMSEAILVEGEHLSTDVPEPPAETTATLGEGVDVEVAAPVKEQLTEVPDAGTFEMKDDSAAEIEPLTEFHAETLSIQTSFDTTTFTPVVDSGIELKEHESQPPQLLSIAEEVERPKSPWSPSFQVTTIGRGELPEDEVKEDTMQDTPAESETVEVFNTESAVVVPVPIVEDVATVGSEDPPSEDGQSLEPPRGPWTPSYSVHLQGSPMQVTKELFEDVPAVDEPVVPVEAVTSEHEDELAPPEVVVAEQETTEETTLDNGTNEEVASNDVVEQVAEEETSAPEVVDDSTKEELEPTPNEQTEASLSTEALEPPARPWTPSYSVHAQGSPLQPPKELDTVAVAEIEVLAEDVTEPTEEAQAEEDTNFTQVQDTIIEQITEVATVTPAIIVDSKEVMTEVSQDVTVEDAAQEPPERPWTPSYSVHAQGTPVVKEVEESPVPPIDAEPLEVETSAPNESLAPQSEPLAMETESAPIDIPAETWTPSYSVHSQGSPMVAPKELDGASAPDTEPVETSAPVEPEPASLEPPAETWTPSYSVHSQGSPMVVTKELEEPSLSEAQPESDRLEPSAESWTPSYPVHSQGTPLTASKELEEPPTAEVELLELSTDAELNESAVLEQLKGPWTPSYLVHSQGTISKELEDIPARVEPIPEHQNEDAAGTSTDVLDEHKDQTAKAIPAVGATPIIALATVGAAMISQYGVDEREVPARPWTPSYSIHSQGSPMLSPMALKSELPDINNHAYGPKVQQTEAEQQVTEVPEIALQLNDVSELPSEDQAASYSVTMQGIPTVEKAEMEAFSGATNQPEIESAEISHVDNTPSVDKTTVPILSVSVDETIIMEHNNLAADLPERPKSPWTPSYSVTKQGAGLSAADEEELDGLEPLPQSITKLPVSNDLEPQLNEVQESNAVQLRSGYNVAGTEDLAKNERFMLFGLRAIVAYLWVLPKWLSMTRPGHGQREPSTSSTSSSSKIFPGGWFTSRPNEGRTSLDVAQGEFASIKTTASTDVFESLSVEVASDEVGASSVTDSDTDGQRRKWCVVM
ncbi:hypothetical protein AX15_005307 [Amanita polypyramis BW_CC]|nr:hypothetical protein AX15_005307 [Amanita polypyramis BW_CC]